MSSATILVLILAIITVIPVAMAADDLAVGTSHEDIRDNVVPEFHVEQLVTVQIAAKGDRVPASYMIPSANDTVDGPVGVTCDPGQGTLLGSGIHRVTCTASDRSGNTASTSIFVLVSDTEPLKYEFSVSDPTAKSAVIISGTEHTFANLEPETDYTISLGVQGYDETQYTMNIGTAMDDSP